MPRATKACSHPTCPKLAPCPKHAPKPWAGSTRSSRLPGNWNTLRRIVLERDPICAICGDALSTVCDHVEAGDDHSLENLQGICSECDRAKSSAEGHAARRRGGG